MESALSAGTGIRHASPVSRNPSDNTSPDPVNQAFDGISRRLDQSGLFNDVTHRELLQINGILASLTPAETRQVIDRLADESLKTWADEIGSHGLFGSGGLSADERADLFGDLASDLDLSQLNRLYRSYSDTSLRSEWLTAAGQAKGTEAVKTALRDRMGLSSTGAGHAALQVHLKDLNNLQHATQMSLFANDVYRDFDPSLAHLSLQPDTRRLDPEHLPAQLGLSRNDLIDNGSGYHAAIYQQGQGGDARYILAFRGTENGTDWLTNLGSGVGFRMTQFSKADLLVGKLVEAVGNNRVEVTGHSLGGGLSNYVGMKHSVTSTAFNPKGTTWREQWELQDEQAQAERYVHNYQVSGEILTGVQETADPLIMEAPGPVTKLPAIRPDGQVGHMLWETLEEGVQWLSPFHDAARHDISGPVDRHGMDYVSRGLAARMNAAESQALRQLFDSLE
ncbi:MAG: hypothetical protein ABW095_03545 [Candidatus Thiodiazotropha sp.]